MATMKVHGGLVSTATKRVLVCLNEKDLHFQFVLVDMRSGEHRKSPFLSRNPFGQVPAFEDGDLKLFESRAITKYIAHTYAENGKPLTFENPTKMAIMSVWMEVEALQFDPPASKLHWELYIKPLIGMAADAAVVEENEAKLSKVLDIYEARLAESKYMGGDCFSLVDLHHLPVVQNLMGTQMKKLFDSRPRVSAWCADILARPAWLKVLAMDINSKAVSSCGGFPL
ncbi:glutathione transferase [Sarracenia purpurea var. burkii]